MVVSLTLQSNGYSLQSVGYSPWGVKSSLHWELSECWLLFIFNSAPNGISFQPEMDHVIMDWFFVHIIAIHS